ncbi:ABC transporter ATP-binding protein [Saccharopolyspora sp. K220]|uniref:ABC transporter ATP-binding protein n=1 Tax=Saccharopolyspora soli TaxID=2926618 RepID=UPI001F56FFFB|nr:ABC transporter ATP-binding protein [Saccharopolyspora soli]MCI2423765.1 ABC transporter ATP-binding protein [Saccharopolyspora soli]
MTGSVAEQAEPHSDPAADPILVVDGLHKRYGDGPVAVDDITLNVRRGEFVSLVGPSGCGKTTLMKCISGLLRPTSGRVALDGAEIDGPPREMVLVFQDYSRSLYPWLTVFDNVEMPLKASKQTRATVDRAERKARVTEALEAVGLAAAGPKYPWQLSGGMQQRVALARAIAFRSEILLLDEPFASVDALVREELEDLVLRLRQRFGITVILVTHDIDEAVYLSDRVFVLGPPPSKVVREVAIDLPRPRDQLSTRRLPEFGDLRLVIHEDIMRRPAKNSSGAEEERP